MMVNENITTRDKILSLLFRSGETTLSGTKISEAVGISRVAVWKHIKTLISSGVDIDSKPTGYALSAPEDLLLPFCFDQKFQDRIFHFQEIPSSMDMAKTLAREGAPHMSCCIAENQTTGRGRLNRKWVTAKGGLWFTLILKPDLPPPMAYIYNFAASFTLARVMNRLFGLDVRVKWPNDLLLNKKKLTGRLSELETQGDMIKFLTIGIGINVNNDPTNKAFEAISLKNALGRPVSRRLILSEFLTEFESLTAAVDVSEIMAQWKSCTATLGQQVRVETMNEIYEGRAVDIDDTGALILKTDDKKNRKIIYGDCFHT